MHSSIWNLHPSNPPGTCFGRLRGRGAKGSRNVGCRGLCACMYLRMYVCMYVMPRERWKLGRYIRGTPGARCGLGLRCAPPPLLSGPRDHSYSTGQLSALPETSAFGRSGIPDVAWAYMLDSSERPSCLMVRSQSKGCSGDDPCSWIPMTSRDASYVPSE